MIVKWTNLFDLKVDCPLKPFWFNACVAGHPKIKKKYSKFVHLLLQIAAFGYTEMGEIKFRFCKWHLRAIFNL